MSQTTISSANIRDPKERVLMLERAVRAICEAAGTDPADGTMMLLTAAVHMAMVMARKPAKDVLELLASSLGYATVAAEDWFALRVVAANDGANAAPTAPAEPTNVIQLDVLSDTEAQRRRFEAWAGGLCTPIERESYFIRSKRGDYVRSGMRMAWLAWQARALVDATERRAR
ncbi:MAG: hypothetical protein WDM91_11000 [Rhizomicrobium sp.]